MILVIAEKPSVGGQIAKVLEAKHRKDGYIEGNGYCVSWCVGHLVGLCEAVEYDEKYQKWELAHLPIIPDFWQHRILPNTKSQFAILKKLMFDKDTKEIICATDAGREGELIFRLVYEKAGCKKPVKRLWVSSMEDTAIAKGFKELKDGSAYDALYQSALCRSKADWMVGINATRLFSIIYHTKMNVGRVQTPTLAMLVERAEKISNFVKEKYYIIHLKYGELDAVSERYTSREDAQAVVQACNGQMCVVTKIERQKKVVNPPKLYDLTTLQREANRSLGYTAQQTLDYTQALYEKKLVTYPRTDAQYLTDDMADTALGILPLIHNFLPYAPHGKKNVTSMLNSKKVTDHYAIIPTSELENIKEKEIPEGELSILELICIKMLAAAEEAHVYETVTATLSCNEHSFTVKAKEVIQEGYTLMENAYRAAKKQKDDGEEKSYSILEKHAQLGPVLAEVTEQETTPPKYYNEDTLLSAMERAGNEEATVEVERRGIGTPATRASIIEKLVKSGYVQRLKKNLVPTESGLKLISVLPDMLKSAKMTSDWEYMLSSISLGQERPEVFLEGIQSMVEELVMAYKYLDIPVPQDTSKEEIGRCPRCGSPVYESTRNFYCSSRDCQFALWKNDKYFDLKGKSLDKKIAVQLLKKGKVDLKGLKSTKTGKTYDAAIILDDPGTGYTRFRMEFKKK